ncbi:peptidoglycan DD-metalloendopeptidase family protein [Desulfacinum hydrothermale]|nr:peptidoglycan DD-metalloendopeptidase family protein [Desulfacinum hydrothermale]
MKRIRFSKKSSPWVRRKPRGPRAIKLLGVAALLAVAVFAGMRQVHTPPSNGPSGVQGQPSPAGSVPPEGRSTQNPPAAYDDIFSLEQNYWARLEKRTHQVVKGDSLYKILQEAGLPAGCVLEWKETCPWFCRPDRIRPGDRLAVYTDKNTGEPVRVEYTDKDGKQSVLAKVGNTWVCRDKGQGAFVLQQAVSGTVTDNLYTSCLRAGLPASLIMELADIFAFDIDFNTDLRTGDTFAVYFDQTVRDGRRVKAGPIRAATMRVSGRTYEAHYYELPDGYGDYFDEKGRSLRKMFLKAPLSYRRISSTFTYRRFHPILKIYRPHLGIDYAAPTGTPVSALGDGKVIFRGWKGGFGRFVAIKHNATYKTTYGHLSRFAKGLKVGSRVKQGEVIGYVGQSGLATGPHLDFRFYKNGKPINFLKTTFPHARSVPKKLLADFQATRRRHLAKLQETAVARVEAPSADSP